RSRLIPYVNFIDAARRREKTHARMEGIVTGYRLLCTVAMLGANALGCRHGTSMSIAVDGAAGGQADGDAGALGPDTAKAESLPESGAPPDTATPLAEAGVDGPAEAGSPPAEVWSRTYDRGKGFEDRARAVALAADGAIVVAGETQRTEPPIDLDIWVRKYDAAGNELWTRTYDSAVTDGLGDDQAFAVAVDGAGAAVVAGKAHRQQMWLRKYDAAGTELWTVTGETGVGRAVAIDKSGSIVLTGESLGLRRYDGHGQETSRQPLPGLEGAALALVPDGSMVVVGSTPGIVADVVVRK